MIKLSPFPFVMLGLNPPRSACSRMATSPFLAASNSLVASASASGGSWDGDSGGWWWWMGGGGGGGRDEEEEEVDTGISLPLFLFSFFPQFFVFLILCGFGKS